MKSTSLKTLIIGLSVAVASPLVASAKDMVQFPIADNTKIVVHYYESVQPLSMGGAYPTGAETNRLYSFSKVIKEAFEEADLKADIDVVRSGSRETGDLDINIMISRWDLNQLGEYECRFTATISNGEEKINLGVFTGIFRELTYRDRRTEHTYDVAARKAVDKLLEHFIRA